MNNENYYKSISEWQYSLINNYITISKKIFTDKTILAHEWCDLLLTAEGCETDIASICIKLNKGNEIDCYSRIVGNNNGFFNKINEKSNINLIFDKSYEFDIINSTEESDVIINELGVYNSIPSTIENLIYQKFKIPLVGVGIIFIGNFNINKNKISHNKLYIVQLGYEEHLTLSQELKLINNILTLIGKEFGNSIYNIQSKINIQDYIDDLIRKSSSGNIDLLYREITKQILSLTNCTNFAIWDYDPLSEYIILNYIYGSLLEKPKATVIRKNNSWLGNLIENKIDYSFIPSSVNEPIFDKEWAKTIGDKSVKGYIIYDDNKNVQGAITLFYDKNHNNSTFEKLLNNYFSRCFYIIKNFSESIRIKRRELFHSHLLKWVGERDDDEGYKKLVDITKSVMGNCECSIFLRNENNSNMLDLKATTSERIKYKINDSIYDLTDQNNKKCGITGRIFNDKSYQSIIFKAADNNDYSGNGSVNGGLCDEIEAYGNASIIFARIKNDAETIGIIRCIIKSSLDIIDGYDNYRIYRVLTREDLHLLEQIAIIFSLLFKLINHSKYQYEYLQELEHETLTPIAVIKQHIDLLRLGIVKFANKKSDDLLYLIDKNHIYSKDTPLWNRDTKHEMSMWLSKLQTAMFETDLIESWIRSQNELEINIDDYSFSDLPVYKIIVPVMHVASYLTKIKEKKIDEFQHIINFWRGKEYYLSVDTKMFNQAFLNILNNAIKYCYTHDSDKTNIWFVSTIEEINIDNKLIKYFSFTIYNYGPKITDDDRNFLFQKRKIGSTGIDTGKGGKGLGLYFANNIINNLNGKLELLPYSVDNKTAIPIMAIGGEDTAKLDCCVRIIQPSNAS